MAKVPQPRDVYSDLDKSVEIQCGDRKVHGTINRICSSDLVDVLTDDGRTVHAVRSKTEPGKWIRAGKGELWADALYAMHHPWRPGDKITIDACVWVPCCGNGGSDIVELPLSAVIFEEKERKNVAINFNRIVLDSELLRQIRMTGGWKKTMKVLAGVAKDHSQAGLDDDVSHVVSKGN